LALLFATFVSAQPPGPPVSEPVDANVLNFPDVQTVDGTVGVSNFPNVQTVDGTVSVSNFPQSVVTQFARGCQATGPACAVDLTDLALAGEVHITNASGGALDVGEFASPRFNNGSALVVLPPTINSTGTGFDRDLVFGQSMDLIPDNPFIRFEEPQSSQVFFYLSGYVVSPSGTDAAAARALAIPDTEGREMP
jgi:hypothetical protein